MHWKKLGKVIDRDRIRLNWYQKNAMMALPYILDSSTIRIFVTFCDSENVGRIGYVDVSADNPTEILSYSTQPVIDIGEPGSYDDNGVVTGSLFENEDGLYLFYSGYQLCKEIPYMIFSGATLSKDRGEHFTKLNSDVPMLDRIKGEKNFRCVPNIIQQGTTFLMWYLADCLHQPAWLINDQGKMKPRYQERYLKSNHLLKWAGSGKVVLEFNNPDEHGLSIGSIWIEDGIYKCIYSVRSLSKGYRLGYAEAHDGIHFKRMDDKLNLEVSENGFDNEMICYPKRLDTGSKIYLFYSGNHYGMGGIGVAELVDCK